MHLQLHNELGVVEDLIFFFGQLPASTLNVPGSISRHTELWIPESMRLWLMSNLREAKSICMGFQLPMASALRLKEPKPGGQLWESIEQRGREKRVS